MNPRERRLLLIIGVLLGIGAAYKIVDFIFLSPIAAADRQIDELIAENNKLDAIMRSRAVLSRRWNQLVARTLSFDAAESSNLFAKDLKEIAKRHGFVTGIDFNPTSGTRIGSKTGVTTLAQRISAEGKYSKVLAFISDLYKTPYWSQITRLSLNPITQRGRGRDEVKFDLTIETPVAPKIEKKASMDAAKAATLPPDSSQWKDPARGGVPSLDELTILADRNIFRPYLAPPSNVVMIDNQDWKSVAVKVRFRWDEKVTTELPEVIARKSQKSVTGKGDVAEIEAVYADGTPHGPGRLDFSEGKGFTYVIPVHSPPPPPEVVDLGVDNQDKDPVDLEVTVTSKDGKSRTKPTMRIKAATKQDIDTYEATTVQVVAVYANGTRTNPVTFNPKEGIQTYIVPPAPAEQAPPPPVKDPDPDPTLAVTGLVTYEGVHEMIANSSSARRIFQSGEEGAVDGGTLLAVHPLGGVVKMPSGNYYIYPLGRRFAERVRLEAKQDEELSAAIDSWSRQ